jgi:hypothetical protein
MRTLIDQPAAIEHNDLVRSDQRRQPVRYDDDGATFCDLGEVRL